MEVEVVKLPPQDTLALRRYYREPTNLSEIPL